MLKNKKLKNETTHGIRVFENLRDSVILTNKYRITLVQLAFFFVYLSLLEHTLVAFKLDSQKLPIS